MYDTSSLYILNLEVSSFQLAIRATQNETFNSTGEYAKIFEELQKIQVETGAELLSYDEEALKFPFEYSTSKDSYIKVPKDWATYFPDQENAKYVGITIKPEYVNIIFPRSLNLNRYAMCLSLSL